MMMFYWLGALEVCALIYIGYMLFLNKEKEGAVLEITQYGKNLMEGKAIHIGEHVEYIFIQKSDDTRSAEEKYPADEFSLLMFNDKENDGENVARLIW